MFSIRLQLSGTTLTGLKALDLRRALGLDEKTYVYFQGQTPAIEVGEEFARLWFKGEQVDSLASVPVDMICPEDVIDDPQINSSAVTWAELTAERAKELYVAVRFRGCQEETKRLQSRVDELEARAEEEDETDYAEEEA